MSDFKIDRPIGGEVNERRSRGEQATSEEFLARIDALLSVPGIKAVVWDQYTPYFNDGDATEFGVYETRVVLDEAVFGDEVNEDNDYNYGLSSYELFAYQPLDEPRPKSAYNAGSFGSPEYNAAREAEQAWSSRYYADSNRKYELNGHSTEAIVKALDENRIDSERYYAVLETNFGDHAQVTATKDGFDVEYYEHD